MDAPHSTPGGGNRLLHEKSPYLLQHAHNPVDWMPWGEEAFQRARREDKPIFLSIGYSTCHWCHVMAHESFENPATAAVMNALFVNVKLDREERPDVDRVYMTFVQATSGSGGWPMSVWLQPDLKPIAGGTYFPPDDRYGRRGFVSVCRSVAHAWEHDRAEVTAQGNRILDALRDHTRPDAAGAAGGAAVPSTDVLRTATRTLAAVFDPEWGGFGPAPKFPRPVTLNLLAVAQARLPGEEGARAREMLFATLDRMAAGGLYDHLGGGFHRYSVDRFWHVPHFEKMLYDQAQLVVAYLQAYQITGEPSYADTARGTLEYVRRDLRGAEGSFFCAEDADSLVAEGQTAHAEGAFYVWTKAEIDAALPPEEAAVFCARFGVREAGNAPPESDPHHEFTGKNILFAQTAKILPSTAAVLMTAGQKLFSLRARRPRPHRDDKIITAWNGLMISAQARAFQVLEHANSLPSARRAADFVRRHLYRESDGTLLRSYREGASAIEGFADDYAFLIQGLLDLYETRFHVADLLWAEKLQDKQDTLFYDAQNGGYFSSSEHDPSVLLRLREDHDGAEPSASSVSALNLVRLAAMLGRGELRERAAATVAAFGAARNPARTTQTMPLMLVALDALSAPPRQIVVAGRLDRADTHAMLRVIHQRFIPGRVLLFADGGEGQRELARRLPSLEGIVPLNGKATAYLCENGACQLPTNDPAELIARL